MKQEQLQAVAQSMSQLLRQHKRCEWLMQSGQPVKAQALALSALHLADSMPALVHALSSSHIWRMRLNELLLRACVDCGINWRLALQTAQKLQPVYEIVYPQVIYLTTVKQRSVLVQQSFADTVIWTGTALQPCFCIATCVIEACASH